MDVNNKDKVLIQFFVESLKSEPDYDNNVKGLPNIKSKELKNIIVELEKEGLIEGAIIQYGGQGYDPLFVYLGKANITDLGKDYVEKEYGVADEVYEKYKNY